MDYYSVFESINRNCNAIHGTIDEICNSLAVIDVAERFMKEFDIKDLNMIKKEV